MINFLKLISLVIDHHCIWSFINKNTLGICMHCRFQTVQHESFVHKLWIVVKYSWNLLSWNMWWNLKQSDLNDLSKFLNKSMIWTRRVYFLNQLNNLLFLSPDEFILLNQRLQHSLKQSHPLFIGINFLRDVKHLIKDLSKESSMTMLYQYKLFNINLHPLIIN